MNLRTGSLCLLLLLTACRDLTLPPAPPPPGPGTLSGRLIWQRPGRLVTEPAAGARVFLLGSNLAVTADDDGRFTLEGLTTSAGAVLMRFDSDGDGAVDRQRTFRLADVAAGLGRQVSLGEVLMGRAAVVSGKLLREDVPTRGGHAGTSVFVPGAPFVTTTGDDGTFVFEALPEGPVRIAALRATYEPFESGDLVLRAGEHFAVADGTLTRTSEVSPGQVRGRVLDSSGAGLAGVTVTLAGDVPVPPTTTDAAGAYVFNGVAIGRYDARFDRAGSLPAALYNVVVFGTAVIILPDVVLSGSSGPSLVGEVGGALDAGPPPDTDAGVTPDGGSPDGGSPDGGGVDGGGSTTDSGVPLCNTADGGPPLAFLDAPPLVDYGEQVTFSAGRSIDPDCLPLRYRWTVLDGGVPPFTDNNSYTASAQQFPAGPAATEYVLAVEVVDDQGLTAQTSARVLVTPRPRVDAGVDFPNSLIGRTVTLDASGSREELGRALSFTWRVVSGPGQLQAVSGPIVPMTVNAAGPVVAEVSVCHLPQYCSAGRVTVQGLAQDQVMASILPAMPDPLLVTLGGSPLTLQAQGSTLTGQVAPAFSWQGANLNFSVNSGPTTDVTGITVGDWPVQLQANAGSASVTVTRTVRVLPPPLAIIDAGVSTLALWMTLNLPVDPASVNSTTLKLVYASTDAGVLFQPRVDTATNRVVAVFDTPQVDQQLVLRLTGATLDGGALGPVTLARTTGQLRFATTSVHNGIALSASDLSAGVAYTPRGPVAVGRYKGGTGGCQTTPCLTAFGLRSIEQFESVPAGSVVTPMRRAVAVGTTLHAWVDNTNLATRVEGTFPSWGLTVASPPGPLFTDGIGLWGISGTLGISMLMGTTWMSPPEVVGPGSSTAMPPRVAGAVSGGKRHIVLIDDTSKALAWDGLAGMSFTSRGQIASTVTKARVAATPAGNAVVALLDTGNNLTLYRFSGSWLNAGSIGMVKSFDLVSRGDQVFLAWTNTSNQLQLALVDPATLTRAGIASATNTTDHATPGVMSIGEVELAVSEFGELAVAWSEQVSGGWRLMLSELR